MDYKESKHSQNTKGQKSCSQTPADLMSGAPASCFTEGLYTVSSHGIGNGGSLCYLLLKIQPLRAPHLQPNTSQKPHLQHLRHGKISQTTASLVELAAFVLHSMLLSTEHQSTASYLHSLRQQCPREY